MKAGLRSGRLPRDLAPNALARALAERRRRGAPIIDLTESNPTRVGLAYPTDLLAPLSDPAALQYDPQPLGLAAARQAVAQDMSRHGIAIEPDKVALTASTSEAYGLLFKLFCDAGDRVLVPRPSYPLFDHLTRLDAVEPVAYDLEYHGSWRVDLSSLASALDARTRAVIVVSPNNPTGSFLHPDDLSAIVQLCAEREVVLIGDEVFVDYPLDEVSTARPSVLSQRDVVTCALGGLSKSAGLPQVKLGWIAWSGPDSAVADALEAYAIVADSYLSVSTPVQVAAPRLLAQAPVVRDLIRARIRRNVDSLTTRCSQSADVTVLRIEGGWSAVVQVPAVRPEEELVVALAAEDGVLVHPGYFFDFAREAFVVVSLIVEPESFDHGLEAMLARVSGTAA